MPKIVGKSTTVVDFDGLKIDELAGNVASHDDTISIARVTVAHPSSEPWLTLEYDEWICVVKGHLELHYGESQLLTVHAGETAFVARGERFRPVFPVGNVEYVPVCLPAFKPERCHREEEGTSIVSDKLRELHSSNDTIVADTTNANTANNTDIVFHMCEKTRWEKAMALDEAYFPLTFETDGNFTHATAVPDRLIETANHFYTSSSEEWICLALSISALRKVGIVTIFEGPKDVGNTSVSDEWKESSWQCPHIFGGIPGYIPGIVTKIYPMKRDDAGRFLSIESLT
jgi:hypothetical protein